MLYFLLLKSSHSEEEQSDFIGLFIEPCSETGITVFLRLQDFRSVVLLSKCTLQMFFFCLFVSHHTGEIKDFETHQ